MGALEKLPVGHPMPEPGSVWIMYKGSDDILALD